MIFHVRILSTAAEYIANLKDAEQGVVRADIESMREGDFISVRTKQLKGKIRELKIGNHRITYFQIDNSLYFIRGFRKKTAKAPRAEIEYAESILNILLSE